MDKGVENVWERQKEKGKRRTKREKKSATCHHRIYTNFYNNTKINLCYEQALMQSYFIFRT